MIFLRLLLIYAIVMFLAYIFQSRLIYLPHRTNLDQLRQTAQLDALQLWPQNNENYRGFIPDDAPSTAGGTVIVFHGNAGAAINRRYYVPPLQRQGFRVVLAEYPGYGARSGRHGETTFVADSRESVRMALEEFGGPVYLWGESLGCGVASAVATDSTLKIDGIVLLTPWNTLPATAQAHYWFLPARWLVRDRFDNISNLQKYPGPVAVLMAESDEVIPNRLTQSLYRNIHSFKRLWIFTNAGHNSWPVAPDQAWWVEVMDFVSAKNPIPGTPKQKAGGTCGQAVIR
ncbi:MAG: alpha/beta fold hydrolase [Acidobacteria bacterium]|nr:alpha/beta fold hydrolase [Acidobacteriota bacterium]